MIRRDPQENYLQGEFLSIHSSHEHAYELVEILGECTNRRKLSFEKHILSYTLAEKPLVLDIGGVTSADTTFYAEILDLLLKRSDNTGAQKVYLCGMNGAHTSWLKRLNCDKTLHKLNTEIHEKKDSAIEDIIDSLNERF